MEIDALGEIETEEETLRLGERVVEEEEEGLKLGLGEGLNEFVAETLVDGVLDGVMLFVGLLVGVAVGAIHGSVSHDEMVFVSRFSCFRLLSSFPFMVTLLNRLMVSTVTMMP